METKRYDILDLTKFILSIMIVAIHSELLPVILYPWLRLAVPLFFMISSFLLFKKINEQPEKRQEIIINFIVRLLKLYLFWFVMLLPITFYLRKEWFELGIINGIIIFIRQAIVSSTFVGSWYIMATIIATLIVAKLTEKINKKLLFIVFLIIYIICCLISSYSILFQNINFVKNIYSLYERVFSSPIFSFPVALIWIFMGKIFADNKLKMKKQIFYIYGFMISAILLLIEWLYVIYLNGKIGNDCYIFLLPLTILIFWFIINIDIKIKYAKLLRKLSTIIYPLHGSIAFIVRDNLKYYIYDNNICGIGTFLITIVFCFLISFLILKLEKTKYFKILKYSH